MVCVAMNEAGGQARVEWQFAKVELEGTNEKRSNDLRSQPQLQADLCCCNDIPSTG